MYKIFAGLNYPDKYGIDNIIKILSRHSAIVIVEEEADIFLFPVLYEILFEYTDSEYKNANFKQDEISVLKTQFKSMTDAAVKYGKKILVFYYRDPVKKIEIPNSVIFRTSLLKSQQINEYAIPAYVKNLQPKTELTLLAKSDKPSVGFRGQAAPIDLPIKLRIRRFINKVFDTLRINKSVNLYYNFGYLARRDAIYACIKNKKIKSDLTITTAQQSIDGESAKKLFLDNILNNQYNICVSGHGNYSFRLYETLCTGRIPVFINTDCVLPFEEFIDWKKHVVWIEEKDAYKTDKLILQFHKSISQADFMKLQQNNRLLWEQYLCPEGFYENLHKYFDIINNVLG